MTTIRMMKTVMTLTILTGIAACDYRQKREFRHERKSARYQAAMADYRAGRLDRAADGFAELLKSDPANASARFQLACLLQDAKRDFTAAYCHYREYLVQQPDSERSKLAHDRMKNCEREMAKVLAEKHGLVSGEAYAAEIARLRAALEESGRKYDALGKQLAQAREKATRLEEDRKRMVRAVREETDTEKDRTAPSLKSARALLDDDDENTDRVAFSDDAKALRLEGEAELQAAKEGSAILPAQPKDAKAKRDAARKAAAAARPSRPSEYTVEEGDTLYGIAERFYGRTSAWLEIRNANKTVISVDGRVKAGDRIVLP